MLVNTSFTSESIKCGEFVDQLNDYQLLKVSISLSLSAAEFNGNCRSANRVFLSSMSIETVEVNFIVIKTLLPF
jgi:hypothetical protein